MGAGFIFLLSCKKFIMFNIKSLAILATAVLALRNAEGEPQFDANEQPMSITLYGPGSKQFQAAKHKNEERTQARAFARMQGKADAKQTAADKVRERAEFLAACTVSFDNFAYEGLTGYEMFVAAYSDIEIGHVADDADKFISERANFLPKPAKT